MRAFAALSICAAALGLALSSGACGNPSDLLPDTGMPDAGPFAVSGTATAFPLASRWFAEQGLDLPSRSGASLRLEDPFVAERMPDAGVNVDTSLEEDGRFAFSDLDGRVSVGLAAVVTDSRPAGPMLSESFLFEGGPHSVSDAKAWMLPLEFGAALAKATKIDDLATQGFLLGVVLDSAGKPVSGAGIAGHDLDNSRVRYLADDLSLVADAHATGPSGAFLVVGEADLMNYSVVSPEGYAQKKAQIIPGRAFLIVFQP
ncbi:MAG: hypothetical protein QM765_24860 [Myxococcales bacterium]